MALIKCPECGKEVSNKAEKCPNCGYDIAKHFENLEKEGSLKANTSMKSANNTGWKITSGIISLLIGGVQLFLGNNQIEYGKKYDVEFYVSGGMVVIGAAVLILLAGILTFMTISRRIEFQIATIVIFAVSVLYQLVYKYYCLIVMVSIAWGILCATIDSYFLYKNAKM